MQKVSIDSSCIIPCLCFIVNCHCHWLLNFDWQKTLAGPELSHRGGDFPTFNFLSSEASSSNQSFPLNFAGRWTITYTRYTRSNQVYASTNVCSAEFQSRFPTTNLWRSCSSYSELCILFKIFSNKFIRSSLILFCFQISTLWWVAPNI